MRLKSFISFVALIVICISCSTGEKALRTGDYYNATLQSLDRLRSNPDSKKAKAVFRKSYPMAIQYYSRKAESELNAGGAFAATNALNHYSNLQKLADEVDRCPAAEGLVPEILYYNNAVAELKPRAANENYVAGIAKLKTGDMYDAREAYFFFEKTLSIVPMYKDAHILIKNAQEIGTLNVEVESVPVSPSSYRISADFFQTKVFSYLNSKYSRQFVKFYTARQIKESKMSPDEIVQIVFDDFVVGETHTEAVIREVKRDSVVVGTVKMPDGSNRNVYGTVKAKITENKVTLASRCLMNARIISVKNNLVLNQQRFPGEYNWQYVWGNFNGDERALTKPELDMCNRRMIPAPSPNALFEELANQVYSQLAGWLDRQYSTNRYTALRKY